jgi:hypothetical protein
MAVRVAQPRKHQAVELATARSAIAVARSTPPVPEAPDHRAERRARSVSRWLKSAAVKVRLEERDRLRMRRRLREIGIGHPHAARLPTAEAIERTRQDRVAGALGVERAHTRQLADQGSVRGVDSCGGHGQNAIAARRARATV